ncbi:GDSL esterase/lipase LTL1-like isoform X3 [Prosopis cineraria]|uniref:GDSL esterase/lipase LTL1-like isoform X3 n=1 Tax=Prosopis cineraria TaxID=364024 RepID=UPI00240F6CD0|nr:GDSL esterase/lipase LTL1-like isoform X3 [Prosopis cineraria]
MGMMRRRRALNLIGFLVVVLAVVGAAGARPRPRPRAFFVFGDSLVDSGNNNYLATSARADSPPYGIDYPTRRPTGRFSNGLNIPDLISQQLGAESALPYLSPRLRGDQLLVGANFASAGIGILNDTGVQFVRVFYCLDCIEINHALLYCFQILQLNIIRMYRQLEYFKEYQRRLGALVGAERARTLVNQALVLVTVGGNDFVNNYYLVPYSARARRYSVPDYVKFLIIEFRKLLQGFSDGHGTHGLRPRRTGNAVDQWGLFRRTATSCCLVQPSTRAHASWTEPEAWQACLHRRKYCSNAQ